MNRTMLIAVCVISLTGCATYHQRIQQNLDSWIGQPEDALYQTWGVPDREMSTNSGKIVQYTRDCGAQGQYWGNGLSTSQSYCNVWKFQIQNGQIVSDRLN